MVTLLLIYVSVCTFFILTENEYINSPEADTQFNFSFLREGKKFNFLHCLGLIDVLSANKRAEIFACRLLDKEKIFSTGFFLSVTFAFQDLKSLKSYVLLKIKGPSHVFCFGPSSKRT